MFECAIMSLQTRSVTDTGSPELFVLFLIKSWSFLQKYNNPTPALVMLLKSLKLQPKPIPLWSQPPPVTVTLTGLLAPRSMRTKRLNSKTRKSEEPVDIIITGTVTDFIGTIRQGTANPYKTEILRQKGSPNAVKHMTAKATMRCQLQTLWRQILMFTVCQGFGVTLADDILFRRFLVYDARAPSVSLKRHRANLAEMFHHGCKKSETPFTVQPR